MIQANELRINNWVQYNGDNTTIQGVDTEHPSLNRITWGEVEYDEIYPIPLTEEILLDCGFEKSKTSDKFFTKNNSIGVSTSDNKFRFIQGNFVCQIILRELKYLHQLQNIIFSICEEELTYNQK